MDEDPKGRNDFVAKLYIMGGIPGIVIFVVVTFAFARSCNFAA